jgi:hypothetical protein
MIPPKLGRGEIPSSAQMGRNTHGEKNRNPTIFLLGAMQNLVF